MSLHLLLFALVVCGGAAWSVAAKKLTLPAALTGSLLATALYAGVGWAGVALMGSFFVLGTLATSWQKRTKESAGLDQESRGRNSGQVLANAGTGGLLGFLALLLPQHLPLFLLLMAGAFSSAAADTVSSEVGSVKGSRFYDVLTFRPGRRGNDGVVSAEGTAAGVAASCVIACVYAVAAGWNLNLLWVVVAGTAGNFTDSVLGATLERKGIMGNDAVNFLNTVVGAGTVFLLHGL